MGGSYKARAQNAQSCGYRAEMVANREGWPVVQITIVPAGKVWDDPTNGMFLCEHEDHDHST